MRRIILKFTSAAAILTAGSLITTASNAAPLVGHIGTEGINMTEKVAWCFYPFGWNGPGFYRCGWQHRRGHGWHGPKDSSHHSRRESRCGHW